jgi:hypothetical protein
MEILEPIYLKVTNQVYFKYFLISYLIILVIGIFLGAFKKISVYEDFNDLGVTLLIFILPTIVISGMLLYGIRIESWLLYLLSGIVIALTVITIRYSFNGNQSIYAAIYSIIVKIPLTLLFTLLIFDLLISKTTKGRRNSSKGYLFLVLLAFTPILLSLIKEKRGVFAPQFLINRARINY